MKHRIFEDSYKAMAVALSIQKDSVKEAAEELGIASERLSKWRNDSRYNGGHLVMDKSGLSEEEQKIRRLGKELREVQMERDILKKAVSIFSRSDRNITGS